MDKPLEITYDEPKIGSIVPDVRAETIFGQIPQVSTAPTWTPRKFVDGFAYYKSGATLRFYIYDFINNAWHYATLT